MKQFVLVAAALPLMLLAACQPTADREDDAVSSADEAVIPDPTQASPAPKPAPGASEAPDSAASERIGLRPLTRADLAANRLDGELGCSFLRTGGSAPLLVAMGVVQTGTRIEGLVRPGEEVARVEAAGDYGALTRGLTLTGDGIEIALTRGASQNSATEETKHDATLRAARADGARRTYAGTWTCGP